jgi:hypothetical protein
MNNCEKTEQQINTRATPVMEKPLMTFLENVYEEMKELNLVKTQDELSTKYLKQCPSYARTLKSRKANLSIDALVNLNKQLITDNEAVKSSDLSWTSKYRFVSKDSIEQRYKRIAHIQQKVLNEMLNRVIGVDKHQFIVQKYIKNALQQA